MKRMKRIAAGIASLAMVASMAVAMPLGASAATSYTGLIGTTAPTGGVAAAAANDNANKMTIASSAITGTENIVSYNATEFKKVLEIEDTANIPAVTFNYEVTVPANETAATYESGTLKTLAVFKGINPQSIVYKLEDVNTTNNTFNTDSNSGYVAQVAYAADDQTKTLTNLSSGNGFVLKYQTQNVVGSNGSVDDTVSDASAAARKAVSDNVVINNIQQGTNAEDTYYAIKTVQMDFSACGFKEPGIYRYYITESGDNQGVTNDYPNKDNSTVQNKRTIDVYVEDATYTKTGETMAANALRIAGYVMYVGHQTAGPAYVDPDTDSTSTAANLEDGLASTTSATGNGGTNGAEVASAAKSEGILNKYDTSDIKFSKAVAGNQASKDKYFKFTIKLTDDATTNSNVADTDVFAITGKWDKTVEAGTFTNGTTGAPNAATVYAATVISNASNASVGSATSNTTYGNNVIWLTGAQLKANDGYSFYLQDAQNITIHGLPNGIGYTITEYQDDYQPTVTLKGATDGFDDMNGAATANNAVALALANVEGNITSDTATATITDTKIEDDVDAAFTNTRKGTIPTGILLSVAAPAGVGAVVIGGIAYLLVKNKRRRAEEE